MRKGWSWAGTVLVFVWLSEGSVTARPGPPPNDAFSGAEWLVDASGSLDATTREATAEPGESGLLGGDAYHSLWWRWKPLVDGTARLQTFGSSFDTVVAVYVGTELRKLQKIVENDDATSRILWSNVSWKVRPGTEYLITVDGVDGAVGTVALNWYLDEAAAGSPANDAFARRTTLPGETGRVLASNLQATREASEPSHAGEEPKKSLWWAWQAPRSGIATFHTNRSNFDTVLAVYTGESLPTLIRVASDDEGGELNASRLSFEAKKGARYAIAVDSFDGTAGMIVLGWSLSDPCGGPAEPRNPEPRQGALGQDPQIRLRWNREAPVLPAVIYGNDDRLEVYEVKDPAVVAAADATVVLIERASLVRTDTGSYRVPPLTFGEEAELCAGERFRDQPSPGYCSGFLVGPDLIATAGHCMESLLDCDSAAFVFGFQMQGPGKPPLEIPEDQVYFCGGIVASRSPVGSGDWALVRLDRTVAEHQPVRLRRSGAVRVGDPLLVIGYPSGLPAKVAGGSHVREVADPEFFVANLDTYAGNSGSAVFNASTLVVEGILVTGEKDFVDAGGCFRSNRCPDDGCAGEEVARTSLFDYLVPPAPSSIEYEVFFGACDSLVTVGTTLEEEWTLPRLEQGGTYCWEIEARSECGKTHGPRWAFSVRDGTGGPFRRGDVLPDGTLNITDAVSTLGYLFRGDAAPPCLRAADVDGDGKIVLTDAVYLLQYLFQAGLHPASPFPDCGQGPADDPLPCGDGKPCVE